MSGKRKGNIPGTWATTLIENGFFLLLGTLIITFGLHQSFRVQ